MTPVDLVEASPERATLPIGAQGPAFDGLLGTDGERLGLSDFAARRRSCSSSRRTDVRPRRRTLTG